MNTKSEASANVNVLDSVRQTKSPSAKCIQYSLSWKPPGDFAAAGYNGGNAIRCQKSCLANAHDDTFYSLSLCTCTDCYSSTERATLKNGSKHILNRLNRKSVFYSAFKNKIQCETRYICILTEQISRSLTWTFLFPRSLARSRPRHKMSHVFDTTFKASQVIHSQRYPVRFKLRLLWIFEANLDRTAKIVKSVQNSSVRFLLN